MLRNLEELWHEENKGGDLWLGLSSSFFDGPFGGVGKGRRLLFRGLSTKMIHVRLPSWSL